MGTIRVAVVIAAMLLVGCSTVATRIQKAPGTYGALSERDKVLVSNGQIREGMGKGAVYLAWGKPSSVTRGQREGRFFESWNYVAYEPEPFWGFGLYPYRWPGFYDAYYGPGFYSVPYLYKRAVFEREKVVAWASAYSR